MKSLIIIGGGFAGSEIAQSLEKKFKINLVDTKDYFEFTPGVLRTLVEPEHIRKIQVLHKHYLPHSKIVIGEVSEIGKNFVKMNRKKKIGFDYLVIASGSSYNAPFKEQNVVGAFRAKNLRNYYDRLCKAKKILIVGGGLVGVELAGEICWKYKNKEITIVHSKERLIERNDVKASSYAENFLKKRNVKILFNEKIVKVKGKKCETDKGTKLEADMIFFCTGISPNFKFMKKNFSSVLDEKGFVKVNEFLQVEGEKNIFAVGDISGIAMEKTAQNAKRQGKVVTGNICALEHGEDLHAYEPKKTPLVISLGKWNGIFSHGKFVFTGIIPGLMKSAIEWREMWKKRKD